MKISLYFKPTCPFCQKVLHYLGEMNKTVEMKDIKADSAKKQELIKIGGKKQVPCLVFNGEALYESDAIILWLGEHRAQLKDAPRVM